jgi:hypothetical protein
VSTAIGEQEGLKVTINEIVMHFFLDLPVSTRNEKNSKYAESNGAGLA